MNVYVIVKGGVYRHEIRGVYKSRVSAEVAANHLAAKEKDNYHEFEVGKIKLNTIVDDMDVVATFEK